MPSVDRLPVESWLAVEEWPLPPALAHGERLAARRAALAALDPLVRRQLQGAFPALRPVTIELTLYDAIYASRPDSGGHWTAAAAWFGPFSHSVRSLSVTLLFDAQDRPSRFEVNGASSVYSADVSEDALAMALSEALRAGPLLAQTPHLFQQIGI